MRTLDQLTLSAWSAISKKLGGKTSLEYKLGDGAKTLETQYALVSAQEARSAVIVLLNKDLQANLDLLVAELGESMTLEALDPSKLDTLSTPELRDILISFIARVKARPR